MKNILETAIRNFSSKQASVKGDLPHVVVAKGYAQQWAEQDNSVAHFAHNLPHLLKAATAMAQTDTTANVKRTGYEEVYALCRGIMHAATAAVLAAEEYEVRLERDKLKSNITTIAADAWASEFTTAFGDLTAEESLLQGDPAQMENNPDEYEQDVPQRIHSTQLAEECEQLFKALATPVNAAASYLQADYNQYAAYKLRMGEVVPPRSFVHSYTTRQIEGQWHDAFTLPEALDLARRAAAERVEQSTAAVAAVRAEAMRRTGLKAVTAEQAAA